MMSEPTTVDGITRDELTGKIVLLIEENRPWHEHALMHQQLSAKVRNYVRYIRSSDFAAEYGERPADTIVRLVNTVPPGENSLDFFARVSWELAKHRIAFEHQIGEDGIPEEIAPAAPEPGVGVAAPSEAPPPEPSAAAPPPAETPMEEEAPAEPEVTEPEVPELEVTPGEVGVPDLAELEPPAFEATPPIEEEAAPELAAPSAELEPTLEVEPPADLEPVGPTPEAPPEEIPPPAGFEGGFPVLEEETLPEEPAAPEEIAAPEEVPWEPAAIEEISELERLIEADDELEQLLEEVAEPEPAPPEPVIAEAAREPRKPSFFPEEEFGRALPDIDEVEAIFSAGSERAGAEPVIETSSGKRISLATPATPAPARRRPKAPAKLLRAALAAGSAALAGGVVWALLSLGAGHGASPLAVAVGLMVGISVRLKGEGHTMAFRLIGVFGTLFGSAIGALMAATTLNAFQNDLGIGGMLSVLGDPGAILTAFDAYYGLLDLISLVLACYIAFRLSASKPSA